MPVLNNYEFCAHCGDEFNTAYSGTYCGDCDVYRCDDCGPCGSEDRWEDEREDNSSSVHAWNYRPYFVPKGEPGAPAFGMELEIGGYASNIVDAVQAVDPDEDHVYLKEDGSISGAEIVTHPMTLDYAHEFPFGDILTRLRLSDCHTDDWRGIDEQYGLHVHVSRQAFSRGKSGKSNAHAMAWLMFISRNAEVLKLLARRDCTRWAAFNPPQRGELRAKASTPAYSGDDRYVAVNCRNRETFELRFFESTLSLVEFYAAIEFAAASVEYTRKTRTSDVLRGHGMSWPAFREFVDQGDDYPNLSRELARIAVASANAIARQAQREEQRQADHRAEREYQERSRQRAEARRLSYERAAREEAARLASGPNLNMTRQQAIQQAGDGGVIAWTGDSPLDGVEYDVARRTDEFTGAMGWFLALRSDSGPAVWLPQTSYLPDGWTVVSSINNDQIGL